MQERPGNSGRRERKLGGRDGRTKGVEGAETVCGNCLANTRNLINAHLFPGRELEVQEEQAEGIEEGEGSGRGEGVRTGTEAFQVHPADAP